MHNNSGIDVGYNEPYVLYYVSCLLFFFANFYALHFVKIYMYHDAVGWHQERRVEFCIMAVEGATEFNWKMVCTCLHCALTFLLGDNFFANH